MCLAMGCCTRCMFIIPKSCARTLVLRWPQNTRVVESYVDAERERPAEMFANKKVVVEFNLERGIKHHKQHTQWCHQVEMASSPTAAQEHVTSPCCGCIARVDPGLTCNLGGRVAMSLRAPSPAGHRGGAIMGRTGSTMGWRFARGCARLLAALSSAGRPPPPAPPFVDIVGDFVVAVCGSELWISCVY